MITETRIKILEYVERRQQARAFDLERFLGLSRVAVHKQLKKLLLEGKLVKTGKPPLVYYTLPGEKIDVPTLENFRDRPRAAFVEGAAQSQGTVSSQLTQNIQAQTQGVAVVPVLNNLVSKTQTVLAEPTYSQTHVYKSWNSPVPQRLIKLIDENFLYDTPTGEILIGEAGFTYWAASEQKRKNLLALAKEYEVVLAKKDEYTSAQGWIDLTEKMRETHTKTYVDRLLVADAYNYPLFGRTKLARLIKLAKDSTDRGLMEQIASIVKPTVERIIKHYHIDAVAFIPPTIDRRVQLVDELRRNLNIALPMIDLVKPHRSIRVPQKSLRTVPEKVKNANETIYLRSDADPIYRRVLLIDDVVGSGASFNETAKKLRAVDVGTKLIVAFALVGNRKGFEVIRQI